MTQKQGSISTETILAYIFGFVFCGVIAYAALRAEPLDPNRFFLVRVLAAISAAGVAAVIPGMLDIQIGQGKLLMIRGAGALGVFVLVYTVNPPEIIQRITDAKRTAMLANYNEGLYTDALRIADEILKADPDDTQALNLKGGVAFYNGDYAAAVDYFAKAQIIDPKSGQYKSNYANALIEIKAYQAALEIFKSIDDGKRDRSYSLGRAHYYAGNYFEARKHLEAVPASYWHGAAKMLEAATLIAISQINSAPQPKAEFEAAAKIKFDEGYAADRGYWAGILAGATRDKHQSYHLVREAVLPFFKEIVSVSCEASNSHDLSKLIGISIK